MTLLFSSLILKAKDYSVRPNSHTAGMRTSSRTPMRDLLALARRFSRSSRPKCHTAEVRYPEAQDNAIRPNRHTAEMRYPEAQVMAGLVTLHSFIHSSGFRIKYGMTLLFSSLILKAKDYSVRPNSHTTGMRTSSRTPMRDLLALARRFSRSSRPNRHTAEMRYPVAWVMAGLVTLHSFIRPTGFRIKYGMTPLFSSLILKAKDYSVRLNRHTAEVRYPVAWVMAGLVTLHSFIHSSGFRIKYGMTPLFSSLILKAKDYSVRLKRHTAEMRYPVAWVMAMLNLQITLLLCLCL